MGLTNESKPFIDAGIIFMKVFLGFVLISGLGWLLDLFSFTVMTQLFKLLSAQANFVSSMIGVTYVWGVALKRIFDRGNYGKSIYLPIYWGYQALSISVYSMLISIIADSEFNYRLGQSFEVPIELAAKILLTLPNLLTNFIFMNMLTKFMKSGSQG
jgi:hypothetical protein